MDPAQMMVPIFGIAAAAAITFYSVSFMQMSDKSFENLADQDLDQVKLRSSRSAKEKRQEKEAAKQAPKQ